VPGLDEVERAGGTRKRVRRLPLIATLAVAALAVALGVVPRSAHATLVVPGYNGSGILLDTTAAPGGSGAYQPLSIISIDEEAEDDFAPGQAGATLILRAPAGFAFRPGGGATSGPFGDITALTLTVTETEVTVTFDTDGSPDQFDFIEISGIEVRPTTDTPTTGWIHRPLTGGGSASLRELVATESADGAGGTSFGQLVSVAGQSATQQVRLVTGSASPGLRSGTWAPGGRVRVTTYDRFRNVTGQVIGGTIDPGVERASAVRGARS
jgi:hypothetical protein